MNVNKKEFNHDITIDSKDEILESYIQKLEQNGYTVVKAVAPITEYKDMIYSAKLYKFDFDDYSLVSSFMQGDYIDPSTFETEDKGLEATHKILYGLFASMKQMLKNNNARVAVILGIKIVALYDVSTQMFRLHAMVRGSFE